MVAAHACTGDPVPLSERFATAMSLPGSASVRVDVTQSMPQMTCDHVLLPVPSRTLTEYSRVPGATPTTPDPVLRAAIVPATWVPWPSRSVPLSPGTQLW